MMKRVMGFEAFHLLGFAPSIMPPWAGTLVVAAEVDEALAVTVEVTTWVIMLAMVWTGNQSKLREEDARELGRTLDYPKSQIRARALKRRRCGNMRDKGSSPGPLLIANR